MVALVVVLNDFPSPLPRNLQKIQRHLEWGMERNYWVARSNARYPRYRIRRVADGYDVERLTHVGPNVYKPELLGAAATLAEGQELAQAEYDAR